jgi:NADH dehydrogenase FAD-containing subunit
MQVKGTPNVFAAGDITSVAEEKTAYFADLCGMVAAGNIVKLDKGAELQVYPEGE